MANLITDAELKSWLGITDTTDDAIIAFATAGLSAQIRGWVGRSFTVDADQSATARYYFPHTAHLVKIEDATEITSVETDDADDGTYSTTWAAGDWEARPVGGIGPTGLTGWPYTSIVAVEARYYPVTTRPAVKVTGKWGWAALPDDVKMACLMLGADMLRTKTGGDMFGTDGAYTLIRRNATIRDLLQPYRTERANDARYLVG